MNAIETAEWLEEFGGDMAEHSAEIIRKQEKVMRQALGALNEAKPLLDAYWGGDVWEEAIKALEEALK